MTPHFQPAPGFSVPVQSRKLGRYCYRLAPNKRNGRNIGCICVLTSEIERISKLLGLEFHPATASTNLYSDLLIDPALLESTETAVERSDTLENKRNLLRWVVQEYGRDKATLQRLGFISAGRGTL